MVCRPTEYAVAPAAAAMALVLAIPGCDPVEDPPVAEDGPEFLTVGLAEEQPPAALGTVMFAQARGGDFLGIVSNGCSYSVGSLSDVQSSCTYLPVADGLRFVIAPTAASCIIEARLYLMCNATCEGGAPTVTETAPLFSIGYCDVNATLVETVSVTVAPRTASTDASSGVSVPANNSHGDAGP
jgi:hypothetical protein